MHFPDISSGLFFEISHAHFRGGVSLSCLVSTVVVIDAWEKKKKKKTVDQQQLLTYNMLRPPIPEQKYSGHYSLSLRPTIMEQQKRD